MSPYDIPLFASFLLSEEAKEFNRWEFDVRVGRGVDPGPAYNPVARNQALALSKLRIDAVGHGLHGVTLFEVKPDARLSALGQIVSYCHFYTKEIGVSCRKAIVTDNCRPDICELYDVFGVKLHMVRPATPTELIQALNIVCPGCRLGYDDIRYLYEETE